jgi:hypothetical protein
MPLSAYLHIQDRESGPIRVVELPWILVRIGRAPFCEVRLADPDLAEEACRLQRRGSSWHLVPLRGGSRVLLEEQPVHGPTPLPFGVPFQIGSTCFTLRQDQTADPDWGMSRAAMRIPKQIHGPLWIEQRNGDSGEAELRGLLEDTRSSTVAPRLALATPRPAPPSPAVPPLITPRPAPPSPTISPLAGSHPATPSPAVSPLTAPRPAPPSPTISPLTALRPAPPSPAVSPLTALHPTTPSPAVPPLITVRPVPPSPAIPPLAKPRPAPQPREHWPGQVHSDSWEARWKAASERLRPALGEPPSSAGIATPRLSPAPPECPGRFPEVRLKSDESLRHRLAPAGRPLPSPRGVPTHELPQAAPGFAPRTAVLEPDNPPFKTPAPPHHDRFAEQPPDNRQPPGKAVNTDAVLERSAGAPRLFEVGEGPERLTEMPEIAEGQEAHGGLGGEGINRTAELQAAEVAGGGRQGAISDLGLGDSRTGAHAEPVEPAMKTDADIRRRRKSEQSASRSGSLPELGLAPGVERRTSPSTRRRSRGQRNAKGGHGEPRPPAELQLPSVKQIFEAASAACTNSWEERPPDPRVQTRSIPTLPRPPRFWRAPFWMSWSMALVLLAGLGSLGGMLSWWWAIDSYNASVVTQRLLAQRAAAPPKERQLPDSVVPPVPSWWRTTPLHLAEWGEYLKTRKGDEDRAGEARELLGEAVRIAPAHPVARLARARLEDASVSPSEPELARHLGLSRDAVSLAWSARILRRAGKREAAWKLYNHALRIACHPSAVRGSDLVFNPDPSARRYLLPGEAQAMAILRDLTAGERGRFEEWSAALPDQCIPLLAAARLLREQGKREANTLLQRLLELPQEKSGDVLQDALRLAAIAEAHALAAQWEPAQQQYREAIALAEDTTMRRSWWFNLADIAARLEDESQRRAALEAALDCPEGTGDEISRRVLELRRSGPPTGRLRSTGTKAN